MFLMDDAPEAFDEPNWDIMDPGVATFAELICQGWDHHEQAIGDDHHWDDDHHWENDDHHWDDNDHDWNQNFHFAGADLGCKPNKKRQ